jgi:hypothetical protein
VEPARTRTFNILSDRRTHRCEEVNNYSRPVTRRFYSADKTLNPTQVYAGLI